MYKLDLKVDLTQLFLKLQENKTLRILKILLFSIQYSVIFLCLYVKTSKQEPTL